MKFPFSIPKTEKSLKKYQKWKNNFPKALDKDQKWRYNRGNHKTREGATGALVKG
jgi:hypothetical protein